MNQLIRKFPSSNFVALSGRQNQMTEMRALLYCWSILPLFGNGGVDGLMKKISKNRYLSI